MIPFHSILMIDILAALSIFMPGFRSKCVLSMYTPSSKQTDSKITEPPHMRYSPIDGGRMRFHIKTSLILQKTPSIKALLKLHMLALRRNRQASTGSGSTLAVSTKPVAPS